MNLVKARKEPVGYVGGLTFWHNYQPTPFNPEYNQRAKLWAKEATSSMEAEGYYANHTREECKVEWRKRYDAAKAKDTNV